MLSNKITKHLNQLQQKKCRREFKEFIIEGIRGVCEALKSDWDVVFVIVEGNKREEKDIKKILKYCDIKNIPVEFCGRKDIESIKTTETFPGVLAVVEQKETILKDMTDGPVICLDQIKDPGNLGTIIRTAEWFGVKNILLSEDCVDPYNEKVVRSTVGSLFHVAIFESEHIVNSLSKLKKDFKYKIKALDIKGKKIETLKPEKNTIYIFGNESHGISQELDELIDERYTISGCGKAESLNVAISAGILLSKI